MTTVFIGLSGLAIGSFLNVLIDRMPRGQDIARKPSHCDYCKRRLRWFELVPVISYLLQLGRCRRCHRRLSAQYPAIELITALGFMGIYLLDPYAPVSRIISHMALYAAMLVIFMIDRKHQIIPDSMLVVSLIAAFVLAAPASAGQRISHMLTGIVSGLFFLALWLGTKGRGIGFGDVKLSFVLGLLLGMPGAVIAFYAAFLTGAFWGVILMVAHRAKMKSRIAFGPFLIFGALVAYLFGTDVWAWWLQLL